VLRRHMDGCIQYLGIIAQADRTAAMLAAAVHNEGAFSSPKSSFWGGSRLSFNPPESKKRPARPFS
jgi:hypothetical protein